MEFLCTYYCILCFIEREFDKISPLRNNQHLVHAEGLCFPPPRAPSSVTRFHACEAGPASTKQSPLLSSSFQPLATNHSSAFCSMDLPIPPLFLNVLLILAFVSVLYDLKCLCVSLSGPGNHACFGGIQGLQNGSWDIELLKERDCREWCYTGNTAEANTGKVRWSHYPTKLFPSEAINLSYD